MTERPVHSPLGASAAERWMNCPGSVALLKNLNLPPSDEPDYRAEGTQAHALLEWCLRAPGGADAWEAADLTHNGKPYTSEMMDSVQVFLDTVRKHKYEEEWIEQRIDDPEFHELFYGQLDHGGLRVSQDVPANQQGALTLDINDYKHGMGVVVEVWHNPQIMYYAYGKLRQLWKQGIRPDLVRLRIIQPRAFHPDGPVRTWVVDADVIKSWAENTLLPAMKRTDTDPALWPGEHCRFCPAKLVCPIMHALVGAAVDAADSGPVVWDDVLADQTYPLIKALDSFVKAVKEDVLGRLSRGVSMAHVKLVHMKGNRVFREGAESVLKNRLPVGDIYTAPELKSPAQIEALGGVAKDLVKEYAYTPETGLTVALMTDKRPAIPASKAKEAFASFLEREGVSS